MLTPEEIKAFKINPVIQFCYDYILPISKDRILATHGLEISLITADGDMICTHESIEVPFYTSFDDDTLEYDENTNEYIGKTIYIEDILVYRENGRYGLMDYNGDIITEAKYVVLKFEDADTIQAY